MAKVKGQITHVVYFDEAKSFGIVKIKLDYREKDLQEFRKILFTNILTVLSSFDRMPLIDEEYVFEGEFQDSDWGKQFKANTFERVIAHDYGGLLTYFSSDLFPKVGVITAQKIVKALGDDAINKILDDRDCLKGIIKSKEIRDTIYNVLYREHSSNSQLIEMLNMGFSIKMATALLKQYGESCVPRFKNNPYLLMYEVVGFGFYRSDEIARHIGIKKDSPVRIKALINYTLIKSLNETGDTFIPLNDLISKVILTLQEDSSTISSEMIENYINELKIERLIVIDDDKLVYTKQSFNDEVRVADIIYGHLQYQTTAFKSDVVDSALKDVEKYNNIEYTTRQKEAIIKAIKEPVCIITGGPGTGKSTIIKGIVNTYAHLFNHDQVIDQDILLCAPTGRAAKRMREVTLHCASTIHKLLQYIGEDKYMVNKENPLDCKMIIIDEFSMVDINLARRLLESVPITAKIVIVGDSDQLPSVSIGNCLHDLIQTKEITTVTLEKIHRQKEGSSIVELAHSIKNGTIPYDMLEKKSDRRFIYKKDDELMSFTVKTVEEAIKSGMDLVKDIQVLIPTYKGELGIEALNNIMQEKFNPKGVSFSKNGRLFRIKDKVLQLINRAQKNVMNGDIGYIEEIEFKDNKFDHLTVVFDIGRVEYSEDELDDLTLAYAISIHKSQGSEFKCIIMPVSFKYYHMLKRKLIYTAVTRAKKYLIMIGSLDCLSKGVVVIEEERKTKLTERIKNLFDKGTEEILVDDSSNTSLEEVTPFDFM